MRTEKEQQVAMMMVFSAIICAAVYGTGAVVIDVTTQSPQAALFSAALILASVWSIATGMAIWDSGISRRIMSRVKTFDHPPLKAELRGER